MLVGECLDPGTPHTRHVGLAKARGHAALAAPKAPGDRGRGQSLGLSPLGQGVEEDVGGGVVALAWSAEGSGCRGEEDKGA